MKSKLFLLIILGGLVFTSCVSKKKYNALQTDLEECELTKREIMDQLAECREESDRYKTDLNSLRQTVVIKEEQIDDLKQQRKQQLEQVGDLTVLSKTANENINQTLQQLMQKDKYIRLLQLAKNKADSINLALAVNLKSVLKDGIEDEDVEVKVDKTVVFINLSDKMLYQSGSYKISDRAGEVLQKIAQIVKSRPDVEVMVEGYTDNVPINKPCIRDNWDLSVLRSTSVVRTLQEEYGVDPNKLIAAGRGEYNVLASNESAEGRSINRRTRIIILPKLNQFYDLLNPEKVPGAKN